MGHVFTLQKLCDVIDPEKEIVSDKSSSRKEVLDKELELMQRIGRILDGAKFFEIPINTILGQHNTSRGIILMVNPADYETLRVWGRGLNQETEKPLPFYKRAYRYIWPSEAPYFTHAVTAVRQRSGKSLWLKAYKQAPKEEVLSLLPAGAMRMNDLTKWVLRIAAVASVSSVSVMFAYQSQYLWGILVTSVLTGGWSVTNYLHGRDYFLRRVGALQYHHCVANNWGAITLAVDLARDSNVKDILLAYLFLLAPPNRPTDPKAVFSSKQPKYHTEASLKLTVEEWLDQNFNCLIKYNSETAIKKLDKLGLLVRRSDGTLSVLSMEETMNLLPKPPSPWETKTPLNLIESELTQNRPKLLQWK